MALLLQERPSGWEDGRTKKMGPAGADPEVILDLKPLFWSLAVLGLPCCLRCQLSFLLRGELLLDLDAYGVHVHFVSCGCVAENLRRVLPGSPRGES